MTSGSEDTLVELGNVIKAYKALQERRPGHELLTIAAVHDDDGGMDFPSEVKQRYWPEGGLVIHFYWNYIEALQSARIEETSE